MPWDIINDFAWLDDVSHASWTVDFERICHGPVLFVAQTGVIDCLKNQSETYIIWNDYEKVLSLACGGTYIGANVRNKQFVMGKGRKVKPTEIAWGTKRDTVPKYHSYVEFYVEKGLRTPFAALNSSAGSSYPILHNSYREMSWRSIGHSSWIFFVTSNSRPVARRLITKRTCKGQW